MLCLTKKRHELVFFLEKCTIISLELLQKIINSFPFVYMGMIFYLYLWREKYKARLPERKDTKSVSEIKYFQIQLFPFFFPFQFQCWQNWHWVCLRVIFFPWACEFIFSDDTSMDGQTGCPSNISAKLVRPNHCRNALFSLCLLIGIPTLASPQSSQCSNTQQIHHLMCQQRHMTTSPRSRAVSLVPCLRKCLKTSLPF